MTLVGQQYSNTPRNDVDDSLGPSIRLQQAGKISLGPPRLRSGVVVVPILWRVVLLGGRCWGEGTREPSVMIHMTANRHIHICEIYVCVCICIYTLYTYTISLRGHECAHQAKALAHLLPSLNIRVPVE